MNMMKDLSRHAVKKLLPWQHSEWGIFVVPIVDYCRHVFITKHECCTDHYKEKATVIIPYFPSHHGVISFGFGQRGEK